MCGNSDLITPEERAEFDALMEEPHVDTWAWDGTEEPLPGGEPAWVHPEAASSAFLVGERITHPNGYPTTVFRVGTSLFGNVYRLRTLNDTVGVGDTPDYWIGDYDEQVLLECQGRG